MVYKLMVSTCFNSDHYIITNPNFQTMHFFGRKSGNPSKLPYLLHWFDPPKMGPISRVPSLLISPLENIYLDLRVRLPFVSLRDGELTSFRNHLAPFGRSWYIHPRSLTASLPLKNGGWKTILSYWEGNFSGDMLNFGRVVTKKKFSKNASSS